jgi:hypothetical protein
VLVSKERLTTWMTLGYLGSALVVPPMVGLVHDSLCNLPVTLLQCPCIDEAVSMGMIILDDVGSSKSSPLGKVTHSPRPRVEHVNAVWVLGEGKSFFAILHHTRSEGVQKPETMGDILPPAC